MQLRCKTSRQLSDVETIVLSPSLDGDLEQPISHRFVGSAGVRETTEEPGNVGDITELAGETRRKQLFLQFHQEKSIVEGKLFGKP